MSETTPCLVMFEAMKDFGGLSYKDFATIILSDRPVYDGRSPRSRVDDKTWFSRYVVHAEYGALPRSYFTDFGQSAQTVVSRIKHHGTARKTDQEIIDYLMGPAMRSMTEVLRANGADEAIYENLCGRVMSMDLESPSQAVELLMVHFITTGCTGDPRYAAECTQEFAMNALNMRFRTSLPKAVTDAVTDDEDVRLCLCRIQGTKLKGRPYILSVEPEGTEIGSLSTKDGSITDVEETVSGRHLRVWRTDDGKWYVEGLGSRNGTVLISGADKSETLVEPPRDRRGGFESHPVEIRPSDRLVLARDTVFMVMQCAI